MINEYYENVRKEIALEFGLEAGGYAPRPRYELPIRIAQRINNKYPAIRDEKAFRGYRPNPKALAIAQRYVRLMKVGA